MRTLRKGEHALKQYGPDEIACVICGHEPWMRHEPCRTPCNHRWIDSVFAPCAKICTECGEYQ